MMKKLKDKTFGPLTVLADGGYVVTSPVGRIRRHLTRDEAVVLDASALLPCTSYAAACYIADALQAFDILDGGSEIYDTFTYGPGLRAARYIRRYWQWE